MNREMVSKTGLVRLTPARLEEVYAYLKAKETQERMSGKSCSAISMSWVLDSGSSHHVTNNPHILQNQFQYLNRFIILPLVKCQ